MTMTERAKLGGAVAAERAAARREAVLKLLAEGECLKRAAWRAGVAYRTARRYRQRARA